ADRRLGASLVETGEAPRLEDRRVVPPRGHEVALADVHDEVVPDDVVDVPERLHVPLVHRVDRQAEHRHDAATAVERERREREQGLPVAELVAEGWAAGVDRGLRAEAARRRKIEAADEARADLLLPGAVEVRDVLPFAGGVVLQVVPEELAGEEPRALLVERPD